jgi:hypothetical protein
MNHGASCRFHKKAAIFSMKSIIIIVIAIITTTTT